MIRKLKSGEYRLYSRKKNPKTGKRRNLGTFKTRAAALKHEREGASSVHRLEILLDHEARRAVLLDHGERPVAV